MAKPADRARAHRTVPKAQTDADYSEIEKLAARLASLLRFELECDALSVRIPESVDRDLLEQTKLECKQQREALHTLIAMQEPVNRADILVLALLLYELVEVMNNCGDAPTDEERARMLSLTESLVRGIETTCRIKVSDLDLDGYDIVRGMRGPAARAKAAVSLIGHLKTLHSGE
jgi:hypothetical protein